MDPPVAIANVNPPVAIANRLLANVDPLVAIANVDSAVAIAKANVTKYLHLLKLDEGGPPIMLFSTATIFPYSSQICQHKIH